DEQLLAMVRLIRADHLHLALANEDWPRFARGYNGAGYRRSGYDRKLAEAFASLERAGLPDLARRAAMLE
ncbi:N-acetylmuramidase domain-containing protein, partial [Klebsiella aerogenes]|uniref:N-acetylmuramidase domain-containing protein n=1 Tax=Klebsiella aerogenes TaxID=548 RepID=UPI0013CF51BF